MEFKKFENKFLIRIDKGEEIVETLKKFCRDNEILLGSITGLGATNRVKVGLYDVDKKEYFSKELVGNYEIAPLYGNISTMNKETYLHLHINLCDSNYNSFGGHLNYAIVSATFEGIIEKIDGKVDRELDKEIGLNLIKF
jgi:hypothetical protein